MVDYTARLLIGTAVLLTIILSGFAYGEKINFSWEYDSQHENIIDGFKIYDVTEPEKPKAIATIADPSKRTHQLEMDLPAGETSMVVVPYKDKKEIPGFEPQIIESEASNEVKIIKFGKTRDFKVYIGE